VGGLDPFGVVEGAARLAASGVGSDDVHAAVAAEGWRLAKNEAGLEVRIPRSVTQPGSWSAT
jgi:hypothetical protein